MKKITLLFVLAILLFSIYSVYAFGVTVWYWKDNPLKMEPGETKEIYLELQNMVGEDDITAEVKLTNGSEIAQLTDSSNIYTVPAHTKDTKINVRVSIPVTDPVGKSYTLGFSIKTITPGGGGVAFGTAFDKEFDVVVIEKPKPTPTPITIEKPEKGFPWLIPIIVLIVIIALIVVISKARKKTR